MDPLLAPLTAAQRAAVEHIDGPLLILAGPGSGKTRTITHRIAYLLRHGVPARQIVALTFTNKAVDQMRERVDAMAPGERIWVSTFHRFGANLLRKYASLIGIDARFTIYDTADSRQVLRRVLDKMDLVGPHCGPERIAAVIRRAKNRLITADEYRPRGGNPTEEATAMVYPEYQARLLASSAVDFDDLLLHLAVLLRENPVLRATLDDHFRYVLVDEYQDTNLAQYVILRAISSDYPNLAVTGDPDQSIYGWRGANLSNILDFEADYPQTRVVRLEQNWRSTRRILRVADRLIVHNRRRKPKQLVTDNEEGEPVRLVAYATGQEEAEGIAARIAESIRSSGRRPGDFAVFYRVNALSRSLEIALSDQGIPYQLVHAVAFYQRKEVRDILAYAHLINNPRDDVAFLRIVNTPARGIGQRTVERVAAHAATEKLSLLAAARESRRIPSLPKRSAAGVARFVRLYDHLGHAASGPVEDLLRTIVAETKYREPFEGTDSETDINRLANIDELITAARQFDQQDASPEGLDGFLERARLVSDTDELDGPSDRVTLMTLHAAKGLEFPVVFIMAAEEGLLPHERSRHEADDLEEERRLFFVGITRAKQELQISYAVRRGLRGTFRTTVPSGFLMELPHGELSIHGTTPTGGRLAATRPLEANMPVERTRVPRTSRPLTTAANLPGAPASTRGTTMPEKELAPGMVVVHPEFGPGKVVALEGDGVTRRATIAFARGGEKTLVLAEEPLVPVPFQHHLS